MCINSSSGTDGREVPRRCFVVGSSHTVGKFYGGVGELVECRNRGCQSGDVWAAGETRSPRRDGGRACPAQARGEGFRKVPPGCDGRWLTA